ncbi:metallophosphoesterase family protein [Corynebacterium phocae]|nr:metallophosphoesterase family protein [Corynebacterium phocae]
MSRALLPLTVFAACAVGTPTIQAPAVAATTPIYRTILQPGAQESQVIVSWRTRALGAKEVLELTSPTGALMTFPAAERDAGAVFYKSNFATATGLAENTTYSYRVGSPDAGWSATETFTTGSFGDDWSFIAVADPQVGVGGLINAQRDAWQNTIATAVAEDPDASLIWSLGDQVEGWGLLEAQYDAFFAAPEIRHIPTNALVGNHEYYPSQLALGDYDEHFINPHQAADIRDYYFERNNILFIEIDSNRDSAADIERHKQFIQATIDERGAHNDWIILGMHHSFYSQGSHHFDAGVQRLRAELSPFISQMNIDAVLSGHDHIYTRSHLMNGTTPVEPARDPARGDVLNPSDGEVLYITTTTAGGGKYYDFTDRNNVKHPDARFENIDKSLEHDSTAVWRQDYTEDYMIVEVTEQALTFTTYNANDPNVVDKVTLRNRDASSNPGGTTPGASNPGANNPDADNPGSGSTTSEDQQSSAGAVIGIILAVLALLGGAGALLGPLATNLPGVRKFLP